MFFEMLDDKTLIVIQMLFEVIVASIFIITIPIYNKSYLNVFKYGFICRGLGFLLIGFRGILPLWTSVIVANTILQLGFFINFSGFLMMIQKTVKRNYLIGLFLVNTILFLYYTYVDANVGARIVVFVLIRLLPILYLIVAYSRTFVQRRDYFSSTITGLYTGLMMINFLRLYEVLMINPVETLFRNEWILKLTLLYTMFFTFLRVYVIFLHVAKEYQEELQSVNIQLQNLSYVDNLTGVNNNRAIMSILHDEIERGLRYCHQTSVVMVDIDDFKKINDTYGHIFGDEVLKTLASLFEASIRQSDALGRYGGEEFLIVLPETSKEDGRLLFERIRDKVRGLKWSVDDQLIMTFSAGVYEVTCDRHITGVRQIIDEADKIMYNAKKNGKDRIEIG